MDNVMEQIRTRLQKGETPQDLIKAGFKRTTVYAINKMMQEKADESNDVKSVEESMDQAMLLAFIIKDAMAEILSDVDKNFDYANELPKWKSIIRRASNNFEESLGKKPPTDFLNPTLKLPE